MSVAGGWRRPRSFAAPRIGCARFARGGRPHLSSATALTLEAITDGEKRG